ncbi:hypothetical protein [Streptomyces boninensis]|uniref:hypothetical protein n=1 Tax=Streptomyces boninensis TaxID=2039455 RepID=UPI003B222559
MSGLLAEVGTRVLDRWLSLLALPGVLFTAAAVWGVAAGHGGAFAPETWSGLVDSAGGAGQGAKTAAVVVALVLAAVAAGYVARGAGAAVRTVWLGEWRGPAAPVARRLASRRRARAAAAAARDGIEPVAAYLPVRPTWMADRMRLAQARVEGQYNGLSLPATWPRLWLLMPEESRATVRTAGGDVEAASVLTGWGVLYLALGTVCYPAAVVGAIVVAVGWRRGRTATGVLAELVESAVDVHLALLLEAFAIEPLPYLTEDTARQVNDRARKGSSSAPRRT